MIERDERGASPFRRERQPQASREAKVENQEQRGYTAQNPQPLNPSDLKPPKEDTAVQPPKADATKE